MFGEKAQAECQRLAEHAVHNDYNTFARGFEAGYCYSDKEGSLLMWEELQRVKARSVKLLKVIEGLLVGWNKHEEFGHGEIDLVEDAIEAYKASE